MLVKCYYCQKREASAKIGESKGNIANALLGRKCWVKTEFYSCRKCYDAKVLRDAVQSAREQRDKDIKEML